MWIQVYDENDTYIATFGLWSYCEYDANMCMSVHDNIIPGKDVPREYYSCVNRRTHPVSSSIVVIGSRQIPNTLFQRGTDCVSGISSLVSS